MTTAREPSINDKVSQNVENQLKVMIQKLDKSGIQTVESYLIVKWVTIQMHLNSTC